MIRAADLQRLVNLYGEPLTLQKYDDGPYNPQTGASERDPKDPIHFVGYHATFDLGDLDGENIIRGDRKVILGNTDTNGDPILPENDDEIIGVGDTVSIVSVSKIKSKTDVICYVCQVRE